MKSQQDILSLSFTVPHAYVMDNMITSELLLLEFNISALKDVWESESILLSIAFLGNAVNANN